MIIQNASALGLDRQFQFWGDNVFRYKIIKNISIEGYVLDLTNSNGVSGITSGQNSYIYNYTRDWEPIYINSVYFGSGYIESLNFDPAVNVRTDNYQANFIVFEDGSLNFPNNANYSGLQTGEYKFLTSLSESFNSSINQKRKSYSHSIDVRFDTFNDEFSINLTKQLAQNLLNSSDLTGFYWSGSTPTNTLYTENYNKITNECSFTKEYELIDRTGYMFFRDHSFTFDSNGVITVTESAEYRGKYNVYDSLIIPSFKSDIDNSYSRCSNIFNAYNDDATNYVLNPAGSSKQITEVPREGFVSYSISYTNDLFYKTGAYWSWTNSINKDLNGINQISENGEIIGFNLIDNYVKQNNANSFWKNTVKSSVSPRLNILYNQFHLSPVAESNIFLINSSVSKNNRAGVVNYTLNYTDDPARINIDGFKRVDKICSNVETIKLSSNIVVPNRFELKQISSNFKISPYSLTINVVGDSSKTLDEYLAFTYTYLTFCYGDYLDGANYSLDPFSNQFSLTVDSNAVECFLP